MKKLSLVLGMVLVAGMAMAQNTSLVDQNGNSDDAIVKQIGGNNDATVKQLGNTNDATVKQTGNTNTAVAAQFYGDRNNASVIQEVGYNSAELVQGMQQGFYASQGVTTIDIAANDNIGSITQIGGVQNEGQLLQVGNSNNGSIITSGNNNKAFFYQGWAGSFWGEPSVVGNNNTGSIDQAHDGNWGGIWQDGSNNGATLHQDGNSNMARISQGYNYAGIPGVAQVYPVSYNQANVVQDGSSNFLRTFQLGNNNLLKLTQNGDYNTVGGRLTSPDNYRGGFFQQVGSNNKLAGAYKSSSDDLYFDINGSAEQNNGSTLTETSRQTGDYNEIGLRQGAGDVATINQNGFNNETVLFQDGGGQNATITQFGNNSTANVLQKN